MAILFLENIGLFCNLIGAILIAIPIFLKRNVEVNLTLDSDSEVMKGLQDIADDIDTMSITKRPKNKDERQLEDVLNVLHKAQRIINNQKITKMGIFILIIGFILQIMAI